VIDIHCHVLPGLDDGPRDLEQALALLRAIADDGVERVVLTPHVYMGHFDNASGHIQEVFERFKSRVPAELTTLLTHCAAEVRLDEHVPGLLRSGGLAFLSGPSDTRTVLLELPDTQIPVGTEKLIDHLMTWGVTPVIAHPERNKVIRENSAKASSLIDMGCRMQVTAGALLGDFGAAVAKSAHHLVDAALVHAVASDAHNLNGRRPRMGAARAYIAQRWGPQAASQLTQTGPAQLCGLE
jgi:protein-tyrosine phosphatase